MTAHSRPGTVRTRSHRRRVLWWSLASVLLLVVGAGVMAALVVPKALDARARLEAAVPLVSQVQAAMLTGDTETARATADRFAAAAAAAKQDTTGVVWRSLEWVPIAGLNLHAVRMATTAVDELARRAVVPAASLSIDDFKPVEGRIDLAQVTGLGTTFAEANAALETAQELLDRVDRSALLGPVSAGIVRIDDALARVSEVVTSAGPLIAALPAVLGADGPRDVLVIFQNNGEVMSGGGTVGSLAQVHIDGGSVSIVAQSSAAPWDMPMYADPVVAVPEDVREIYELGVGTFVQSLTRAPRFDLTTDIAREMWRLRHGVEVDAVIAVDTVALSYLLAATGPVAVTDTLQITSENAVAMLLGDLYNTYSPPEVDLINQAFAGATLSRLMSGEADMTLLTSALGRAVEEGRVRIWSLRPDEQRLVAGSPLDARLPSASDVSEQFGVYFVDYTPGKMQRFMGQAVDVSVGSCAADTRGVRVAVTLSNNVDVAAVGGLPDYVTGGGVSTPKGAMRVQTLSYAPPGYSLVAASADGATTDEKSGTDGDYIVSGMRVLLEPGQSRTLTFEYSADSASEKDILIDVTPVVNPTTITRGPLACGLG